MAGKSAMPLLLIAGAAALAMGGKKKKRSSTGDTTGDTSGDTGGYVSDDADEYEPYVPTPTPKPAAGTPSKPAGSPPGGSNYDANFWGPDGDARLTKIRDFFIKLGYPVESGPWPMNKLGPKGTVELTHEDGTKGKLGGGDDEKSAVVRQFQHDYNSVSRLSKAEKIYPQNMGGLDEDGFVGPFTLNGLRYAVENLPGGKTWQDLLQQATLKGIA